MSSKAQTLQPGTVHGPVGRYKPRIRNAGEALPTLICNSNTQGTYRTGDGEVGYVQRPGSERARGLPSRGMAT